jgi:type I restriction enzyme S subunit
MSDWPIRTIGECAAAEPYSTQIGPFGKALTPEAYVPFGNPLLRGVNVNGSGRFHDDDYVFINDADAERLSKFEAFPDDVLLVHKGSLGHIGLMPKQRRFARYIMGNSMLRVKCDPAKLLPGYLRYWLQSPDGKHYLLSRVSQVGVPQIQRPLTTLREAALPVPPIPEQKAIVAVLGSLDDKIEQNRRTGRKLEELARAVFKAWFVVFEPVKAKAAGAPAFPGMPAKTFAILPTRLVESELGPVPEGWEVAAIKDRASAIQYGLTTSATDEAIGPRFLRITDIRGGSVNWGTVPYCMATAMDVQKYRLVDGDIVVARTGASTGENMYVIEPPNCVFASYLVRFQFADRCVARLVGAFMRTEIYQSFVTGSIGGSAQPNANAQTLASSPLVFPPINISAAFYDLVHPLDLKRAADARESAKLATLRDYLLPRLLSGRVRVGDASIPSDYACQKPSLHVR